jgi:tRNA nucleotidyltransferase (CCA-adding enzyme)
MKVITTHQNADFDALSSMVAAQKIYPDAVIVFPGSQEKTVRDFLIRSTLYFLNTAKQKDVDFDEIDTLILVDTRQKSRIGQFARLLENKGLKVHVYDHHPPSDDDVKGEIHISGTAGACVTLLISILRERNIELTPEEATVMMLGIYEETGSFQYPSTTAADLEAASYLLSKGAHVNIVSEILVKELRPEQVLLLHDVIRAATVQNINGIDVALTEAYTESYVGDLAILVQKFRDMENLNAVFALFRMDDRIYIIGRSRIPEVDVGYILSRMGGGGHKEAASCTIKDVTLAEAKNRLTELLLNHVKPLRTARDIMFFPVKTVDENDSIGEAKSILNKYSINALPVMADDKVAGILTRQIVEKAAFHKLETLSAREYMYTEFSPVDPEDSIERVKEIVIGGNQRFVPVISGDELVGAITRTDLLRILEDEIRKSVLGKLDYHDVYEKRKNVRRLMEERLSESTYERLRSLGALAEEIGFHAYLVGGFVRDLLLRNATFDVDLVVEGDGIQFADAIAKRFGAKIRPHRQFGTAKVLFRDGFKLDIATARLEYYKAPAALPVVEHSSLKLDLYRRDFTINTLAISLNKNTFGELIDFFGAQRDIKEKTIRVLHSLSFVEDPTRVFRAIRFERRFDFQIGKYTLNLIKNAAKMGFLSKIRGARIWRELSLMLQEESLASMLKSLAELDLLKFVFPGLTFGRDKERLFREMETVLKWYNLLYKTRCSAVLYYLLGLVNGMPLDQVAAFGRKMEISESTRKRFLGDVERVREALSTLGAGLPHMKKSAIYKLLETLSREAQLFMMAKSTSEEARKAVSNFITYSDTIKPHLTGQDLKQLGVGEGRFLGEVLEALKMARIDENLKTREQEERFVLSLLKKRGIRA